ncbi:MAG: Rrf2 family transcriptional regulator [Hyphomicrobiaceae bacterium]
MKTGHLLATQQPPGNAHMRLNKSTSHAIRILIECARAQGDLVKVADLSTTLDLTMQNVFKIVHILSKNQLVAPARGRHGGVRLGRPADQIRMGDIVRAMEATDIEIDIEGSPKPSGRADVSGVNRVLDDALEAFVAVLNQHTLADMAGQPNGAAGAAAGRSSKKRKSPQSRTMRSAPNSRLTVRSSGN